MIARTWDGETRAGRADDYVEYLRRTGAAELSATEGNRGVYILRRIDGNKARFRVMSLWESMDAVRRFAGDDPERARYYPEDQAFLLSLPPGVEHDEVVIATGGARPADEVAALADELRRIGEGEAWHGPSLAELLDGVSPAQAAARPIAHAHTIWELVLHIAAWTDVFRRRLEGTAVDEPEDGDYPAVAEPTGAAWSAAQARLRDGHRRLADVVARLTPDRLEAGVPGRDYSARFQVQSAVRHVVYHSGQIGLLKKAG